MKLWKTRRHVKTCPKPWRNTVWITMLHDVWWANLKKKNPDDFPLLRWTTLWSNWGFACPKLYRMKPMKAMFMFEKRCNAADFWKDRPSSTAFWCFDAVLAVTPMQWPWKTLKPQPLHCMKKTKKNHLWSHMKRQIQRTIVHWNGWITLI